MSNAFRELLRKVGSGPHTGKELTRDEAAAATQMMLRQEATPAQIGAFMIAHRIRRPTGVELAGMLDAYDVLGPRLQPIGTVREPVVLSAPYDGRDRTFPLGPLTALMLAAMECPVILHGGDRMPTKEGTPLVDLWRSLGVDWTLLSLAQVQQTFEATRVGFVYLPTHFPLAQGLVPYREQIGKRPPFATLELMWSPYAGKAHVVVGFVHPPTENMVRQAFELRHTAQFTTVKGLEGSCDLPRERTAIIGLGKLLEVDAGPGVEEAESGADDGARSPANLERLHLHPYDYGYGGRNVPLEPNPTLASEMMYAVLRGGPSELRQSVIWNAGFYLWRLGCAPDLSAGFEQAAYILDQGLALKVLEKLQHTTATVRLIPT